MTRKKTRPDPYGISIFIEEAWDNHGCDVSTEHASVTLTAATWDCDDSEVYANSVSAIVDGWRYVAGIIARAAVTVADDVSRTGQLHWCRIGGGARDATCTLEPNEGVTRPQFGVPTLMPPMISIVVPKAEAKAWLKRAHAAVAAILEADAWSPVEAEHMAAPPIPATHVVSTEAGARA